ncbi:hypothetical protein KAI65_03415 [Candidatus Parcubacteria bacterium]|nr:hypothetical protein [Candidatus Parcubacteria bacterium]
MNIIIGLIIMAVGLSLIIKTEWFLNNFGRVALFEAHLATSGGTRLGYKLLGMLIMFIGLLFAINLIGGFTSWILGPVIRLYE